MKNSKRTLIFSTLFFLALFSFAQSGTIRGSVFDGATGEPLIGVTVLVKGTTTGGVTDFDGKFNIKVNSGTYEIVISFVSFQTTTISGVEVKANEVTLLENIVLKEDLQELETVVITADVIRNSEAALLTVKRKSAILLDGISSAKFRQIGDSDAGEAVKRVTGVSVEGGKYVFVRGLGDRYTKTMLNSVDIPGLDPDRNTIQIDIFPTSLIENLEVMKAAAAELPADFTGGVVNIVTKDFPEERVLDISASIGYNPQMHFNDQFLTYDGSGTDFLGFDNGVRDLPRGSRSTPFPAPSSQGVSDGRVNQYLSGFNKNLGAYNETSFMDYSLGLSAADQFNLRNGHSLGYIFSGTYKNTVEHFEDVVYGEYQKYPFADQYDLQYANVQTGSLSEHSVLSAGLAGVAYKTANTKVKFTVMHLQNGETRTGRLFIDDNGSAVGKSGFFGLADNLDYSQKALTNMMLNGIHYFGDKTFSVDWKLAKTDSRIEDPDIRRTAFTYTSSDTVFSPGAAGYPSRIWRYLDEVNWVGKVDFKKDYQLKGAEAVLKFGFSHVAKSRNFEILTYNMQFFGAVPDFDANFDNVMRDEFLYPNGPVYFGSGNANPNSNEFFSASNNTAAYISNQFNPIARLKTVVGLRAEKFTQIHTGRDAIFASGNVEDGRSLNREKVLDALDLFPSLNLIYAVSETQNARFSYSRTIARPSFKELSFAQILDPVSNRTFNGGLFEYNDWDGNLTETRIDNLDLRWELFMSRAQLVSVSAFYKKFNDPIELVRIPEAQTTNEFQPRNVGDGTVLGAELELKKSLDFASPRLTNWFLNGNFTVVRSQLRMTDTEYNARLGYIKEGQTIDRYREMAGQAPYIINAGISYENPERGLDGGLFYNVNGPTLTIVGGGLFPDVFSEPFHSLNLNVNKTLGVKKKSMLTVGITNILGDVKENFFVAYMAESQYFDRFDPGTSVSVGFKHSF